MTVRGKSVRWTIIRYKGYVPSCEGTERRPADVQTAWGRTSRRRANNSRGRTCPYRLLLYINGHTGRIRGWDTGQDNVPELPERGHTLSLKDEAAQGARQSERRERNAHHRVQVFYGHRRTLRERRNPRAYDISEIQERDRPAAVPAAPGPAVLQ